MFQVLVTDALIRRVHFVNHCKINYERDASSYASCAVQAINLDGLLVLSGMYSSIFVAPDETTIP